MPGLNIAHIALIVNDLFEMEKFYRACFGMKLNYRYTSSNQPGMRLVFLHGKNIELELMQYPPQNKLGKWNGHLAFETDDALQEYKRLASLNCNGLTQPRETGDGYLEFSLLDPEGNRIEIAERIREQKYPDIRGVIFDFDGTLVDSEPNYLESDRRLFAEFGVNLTAEMKRQYIGIGNSEMIRLIKEKYNITESEDELLNKKINYYIEVARKQTKPFERMVQFVKRLHGLGLPLAVASGSDMVILEELLELTGLGKYFSVIMSSELVERSKPAPDVFIECAGRMNIEPKHLAVIEDSVYGVEAGIRAGMRVMAVPEFIEEKAAHVFNMVDWMVEGGPNNLDPDKAVSCLIK